MNVDGAQGASPLALKGHGELKREDLRNLLKKQNDSASEASGPEARSDKTLLQRRKDKLFRPFSLRLETGLSKRPLERLVDELDRRLFGELYSPVGSPIFSSDNAFKMYCVPCGDGQRVMIHSLCPDKGKYFEEFSGSFWEMVHQLNTHVCALANPSLRPIYMPPQQNAEALKSHPLNVGDSRHFANGMGVDVLQINLLSDLKNTVLKYQRSAQGDSPVAREVEVELTKLSDRAGTVCGADELSGTSKVIKIDQFFSCWSDTEPVAPEIAHKIVSRLTSPNLQLHCEGGVNRSPAAAAMILLSKKQESLGVHNLLDEVASTIKFIRRCCHNSQAIDRSARISILDFVLHIKSLSSEHVHC